MNRKQLQKELHLAGATSTEVRQLLPLAANLSHLKNTEAETPFIKAQSIWSRVLKPAIFTFTGLVVGLLLVIIAQSASPTSLLYPVQKLSDNVAVSFHPQYRMNVMMKRSQQVNELVVRHASSKQVLATLADYTHEASAYKGMPHANYAAFEYCKDNLQQAAKAAPANVREAIARSVASLEST
jgi:hypothetical protein